MAQDGLVGAAPKPCDCPPRAWDGDAVHDPDCDKYWESIEARVVNVTVAPAGQPATGMASPMTMGGHDHDPPSQVVINEPALNSPVGMPCLPTAAIDDEDDDYGWWFG